jgi:hypothetical protein
MSEKYEDEIFISYAHVDNTSPKAGLDGWITRFHRALEDRVTQVRGEAPRIFRDPKLQGNDIFADVLTSRLQKCGILLSVITPRYLKSEWCSRELKEFWKAQQEAGTLEVGDHKSRVFKIIKTEVPRAQTPEEIQAMIGYEFFKMDAKGRPQELDEIYGPEAEYEFRARLNDLAYDIKDLLDILEKPTEEKSGKPVVYLAETPSTLKDERDTLRRDLQRHGYTVLPDRTLPLAHTELEEFLKTEMARCKVSVHLVDHVYGVTPEEMEESLTIAQNRIARDFGKAGQLVRLIWIKPEGAVADARQQQFIEHVRTDPGLDEGADVLETSLEGLKTELYERLKVAEKPPAPLVSNTATTTTARKVAHVYVVCDALDKEAVKPLRKYLIAQGCEVTLPLFEGDEAELREDHEANLKTCDAVLIYYGQGSESWRRKKMREIQGSVRELPLTAIGVLVAAPVTDAKQDFQSNEAMVALMPDVFAPEVLKDFMARIEAGRK